MFSVKTNIENEKAVLKSFTLSERTITELGLQLSFFKHGSVQTVNQYKVNPYHVIFDTSHLQLANVDMYIDILNDEEFKLKIDCKDQNTYDIKNNKKITLYKPIYLIIQSMSLKNKLKLTIFHLN